MENQRSSVNILPPISGVRLSYCSESCEAEVGQGTSLCYCVECVILVLIGLFWRFIIIDMEMMGKIYMLFSR